MALRSVEQFKKWFQLGVYVLPEWFHDLFDSYWHKNESIPVSSVDGLAEQLNDKYPASAAEPLTERVSDLEGKAREATEAIGQLYDKADESKTVDAAQQVQIDHLLGMSDRVDQAVNTAEDAAAVAQTVAGATAEIIGQLPEMLALKQDKIGNITIANFDTFNPFTDAVASKLGVGESCQFTSAHATGRPNMKGSGSYDPVSISCWAGSVICLSEHCFVLQAYGSGAQDSLVGQSATRVYNYDPDEEYYYTCAWVMGSESRYPTSPGYVKLPSGLMMQWGYSSSTTLDTTITFPIAFSAIPFVAPGMPAGNTSSNTAISVACTARTATTATYRKTQAASTTSGTATDPFYWFAIGTWK